MTLNTSMKIILIAMAAGISVLSGCGPSGDTVQEKQESVLSMESETLERLYLEEPETRKKISEAAGYGIFSNVNVNIILVSAGAGYGVVYDNDTGERTFMRMGLGGLGLGLGAKDFRVVLIFKTDEALDKFVTSGWEFGAHADAAAKSGDTCCSSSHGRSAHRPQ